MSKKSQMTKNIKLSNDLSRYIVNNPQVLVGLPSNASVVAFSKDDESLNKANNTIIKSLLNEGTVVVKAQETNKDKNPWEFTPVSL